jgi:hypothetical protein
MVEHGHSLDVKVGFYQDNCRCHECETGKQGAMCWDENAHYQQDANLTESMNFGVPTTPGGFAVDTACCSPSPVTVLLPTLTSPCPSDALKIDSCGNQRDMAEWAHEFAKPGNHPLMVESCGNGPKGTNPKKDQGLMPAWEAMLEDTCPFSFYRVSVDLAPQFYSTIYNMNRALPYLGEKPLSRPG